MENIATLANIYDQITHHRLRASGMAILEKLTSHNLALSRLDPIMPAYFLNIIGWQKY